jgi:hypothetical protein
MKHTYSRNFFYYLLLLNAVHLFSAVIHAEPANKYNQQEIPSNYHGPVANYPDFIIGEKWVYSDMTEFEVVKTGQSSTIFLGNRKNQRLVDACHNLYEERDRNLNVIFLRDKDLKVASDCYLAIPRNLTLDFPLWIGKQWSFEKPNMVNNTIAKYQIQASVESKEQLTIGNKQVMTFKIVYQIKNLSVPKSLWWKASAWYSPKHKQLVKIMSAKKTVVLTEYHQPK